MTAKAIRIASMVTAALAIGHAPLFAQTETAPQSPPVTAPVTATVVDEPAKPTAPPREDYPDAGQAFGMVWHYNGNAAAPVLAFQVPDSDNRFWTMACKKQQDGSVRIANVIFAAPRGLVANDRFGFTVRVDDGRSIGVLARMLPADIQARDIQARDIQGKNAYMPQFYLPESHDLLSAMKKGSRAYINLNGNKFSMHLNGSGDALKNFLGACQ